jgi:hypothetical protein
MGTKSGTRLYGVLSTDERLSDVRVSIPHNHVPEDIIGTAVITSDPRLEYTGGGISTNDPRLSDARTPTLHEHEPEDIIGGVLVGTDPRLTDARVPLGHAHSPGDITGTAVLTSDSRLSDARPPTTHNHDDSYEAKNANIQAHVVSAHATPAAQKNSDITKAEIEAKLTGAISTHTHAGGGADPFLVKLRLAGDITNATVTPAILPGMVFSYEANSFYVFEMFMLCTSVATTTGYGFALDVSTAVTSIGLSFTHQLATATLSGGDSIVDNTSRGLSSGVPAITVSNPVMGHGILITGANAGTAQFMFRPEVAASATCKAGSIIRVMKIT